MSKELPNQLIPEQEIIANTTARVRHFIQNKELVLPPNYSAENALKAAWLMLQTTVDKNNKPVLKACTQSSIAFALLDMIVQGLNPVKKQCYFLAYGDKLTCMRSYHGSRAVAMHACKAKDVDAQVVWGDDDFGYEINKGVKSVTCHKQKLNNVGKDPQAAYCVISLSDGREYTDIMTIEQIKKAWSKSKMNPNSDSSVHKQFDEEMIKKTVINRTCKKYINSSSDNNLFLESFNRAGDIAVEEEFKGDLSLNANQELIDIDTGEVTEEIQPEQSQLTNQHAPATMEMPKQPEPELVGAGSSSGGNGDSVRMEPDF